MSNMSYLPKVISSEPNRVNSLLIETITLLCRNGLSFTKQLKIEGMIGITIDDSEIALIHINEFLHPNIISSDCQQQHCKSKSVLPSQHKLTNDNSKCTSFNETSNSYSVANTQTVEADIKPNGNNKEFIVESPFLFNTESPSDEEHSLKVESTKDENHHSGSSDIRQNLIQCNNSMSRSLGFDPPHPPSFDKSANLGNPPLEMSRVKSETIDITDEEDCDNDGDYKGQSLMDRQPGNFDGIYSNSCSMNNQIFQRGLNNSRAFQGREVTQNDGFSAKPLIQTDEFLVSMNLDEHGLMSEHLPHLREDGGWQSSSRFDSNMTENDFDHGYQFMPRKRTVGSVDNRPYACPVEGCDRRFFHRNNVYRHRKQKHPLEVIFKT